MYGYCYTHAHMNVRNIIYIHDICSESLNFIFIISGDLLTVYVYNIYNCPNANHYLSLSRFNILI